MNKSIVACAIDTTESAVVQLKKSSGTGHILDACKIIPFGIEDFFSDKGNHRKKKLDTFIKGCRQEELALCYTPPMYLPLQATFPVAATREECNDYCRIEAGYFLNQPEQYECDSMEYGSRSDNDATDPRLLLFYPAEPCRALSEYFSAHYRVLFHGTRQSTLLHLSKCSGMPQVILEFENNYVLCAVARNGRMEHFSCHQTNNTKESEYFALSAIINNPVCRETEVQVTGSKADKAMIAFIKKETGLALKPIHSPHSLFIGNPHQYNLASPATVKAISTALMALGMQ